MAELFDQPENCCGCSACKDICPVSAIGFHRDEMGFEYPHIDTDKCIDCGLCLKVCDLKKDVDSAKNTKTIYAAKIKDDTVRMKSSSGGMFTAFSDYFLHNGGVIYGAAHNDKLETTHIRAVNSHDRDRCIGSKYVQSSLDGGIFTQIKNDLNSGVEVFFTGTPCQVAGLHSYLKYSSCKTDKLLTADLVCHGVPSPMVYGEYIRFCEAKTHKKLKDYIHRPYAKIRYADGTEDNVNVSIVTVWAHLYYSHAMTRPACFRCKYTSPNRYGDITIGDFWGLENTMPDFCDDKGVSLLFLNTDKGIKIFDAIKQKLVVRESSFAACTPRNPNLLHPSVCKLDREKFWTTYKEKGFEALARQYGGYGVKHEIKKCIKSILKKAHLLGAAKKIMQRK